MQRLEDFPLSGKTPIELSGLIYREVVVTPCRVLYKLIDDRVMVLHIVRQERDLRRFLLGLKEG